MSGYYCGRKQFCYLPDLSPGLTDRPHSRGSCWSGWGELVSELEQSAVVVVGVVDTELTGEADIGP